MTVCRGILALLFLAWLLAVAGFSQSPAIAVSAGPDGAVEITLANRNKTSVPKEPDQTGFDDAHIAADGTTGWLVQYNVEGVSYPIDGKLILWRNGRIIRRFATEQSFYSWTFVAKGEQVAYHVGPLHGEQKSHCELHDVASGRLIAQWDGDLESLANNRPAWTKGLNH